MSRALDPCIMQHTPQQLRKFARAFQDAAARERAKADRLENKAARYIARAQELECEK